MTPIGYFIFEAVLFVVGITAFVFGKFPVTRRRRVNGSAARVVGAILMIPLPLYLVACKQHHVSLFGPARRDPDPLVYVAEGYIRLFGLGVGLACLLAATVLAIITSELPRRP
jgi:hypothetical protein